MCLVEICQCQDSTGTLEYVAHKKLEPFLTAGKLWRGLCAVFFLKAGNEVLFARNLNCHFFSL